MGVYENKELIFVAKVKNGFVPRIRDEIFPTLGRCKLRVPIQKSPREKGLLVRRIVNRRENGRVPLGQTEAGLPGAIRRMDDAGHLRHCTFVPCAMKEPAEVVREIEFLEVD